MTAPSRVDDMETYWETPPPAPSAKLVHWLERLILEPTWKPNRRVARLGYWGTSHFFGIYLWEYLHVLSPVVQEWCTDELPSAPNAAWQEALALARLARALRRDAYYGFTAKT